MKLIMFFTLLLIPLVIFVAVNEVKRTSRLMKDCIADGRKEYECDALIRSGRGHTVFERARIR